MQYCAELVLNMRRNNRACSRKNRTHAFQKNGRHSSVPSVNFIKRLFYRIQICFPCRDIKLVADIELIIRIQSFNQERKLENILIPVIE